MDKYYVSGCKDNGSEIETCDDSEATFWTLYERDDKGLSQAIVDLGTRKNAEAVMAVYVERDALQEQVKALAAENVKLRDIVERLIGQYSAAGYHGIQNSLNPGQSLLYDAMQAMKSSESAAAIREIEARGVEKFAGHLQKLIDDGNFSGDEIGVIAGAVHCGADIASRLRNGEAE